MSVTLERPGASTTASRNREIHLSAAQMMELEAAIEMKRRAPETKSCIFSMAICADFICVYPPPIPHEDTITHLEDGGVRLVRPSLERLLEVRERAIVSR